MKSKYSENSKIFLALKTTKQQQQEKFFIEEKKFLLLLELILFFTKFVSRKKKHSCDPVQISSDSYLQSDSASSVFRLEVVSSLALRTYQVCFQAFRVRAVVTRTADNFICRSPFLFFKVLKKAENLNSTKSNGKI